MRMTLALLLLTLLGTDFAYAERINPFKRPTMEPTVDSGAPAARPMQITLRAILPSTKNPMANINGELLTIGEKYQDYEVVAIDAGQVTLRRGAKDYTYTVWDRPQSDQGR